MANYLLALRRLLIDGLIGRRVCVVMLHRINQCIDRSDENETSDLFAAG